MKVLVSCLTDSSVERVYFRKLTMSAYATMNAYNAEPLEVVMKWDETNFDRYYPDEEGLGEFYAISDDDVIPCKPSMFDEALVIMRAHPDIGALGFPTKPRLSKEEVQAYVREVIAPGLWDFDHFGGIRIVRAGVVKKPDERPNYAQGRGGDRIFCDAVRAAGYRCVLAPDLWFHHLGEKFSTIWKAETP